VDNKDLSANIKIKKSLGFKFGEVIKKWFIKIGKWINIEEKNSALDLSHAKSP
jgi:hypothetical protein